MHNSRHILLKFHFAVLVFVLPRPWSNDNSTEIR